MAIEINKKAIGARIKAARKRADLTQTELGDMLGVTKGAVSQWESGSTLPDIRPVIALCQATRLNRADTILMGAENDSDLFLDQLLRIYRELPEAFRQKLLTDATGLWELAHPERSSPVSPYNGKPVRRNAG